MWLHTTRGRTKSSVLSANKGRYILCLDVIAVTCVCFAVIHCLYSISFNLGQLDHYIMLWTFTQVTKYLYQTSGQLMWSTMPEVFFSYRFLRDLKTVITVEHWFNKVLSDWGKVFLILWGLFISKRRFSGFGKNK